mmetsp:Transcript_27739/g.60789  ORF Transcript_27739/g.60789 Transcript_27739/m.60789 type:complete len:284 (-) Transcript_27739:444-1295(-)
MVFSFCIGSRQILALIQLSLTMVSFAVGLLYLFRDQQPLSCISTGQLCVSQWGVLMSPAASFWGAIASCCMLRCRIWPPRKCNPFVVLAAALDLQGVLVPVSTAVFVLVCWHLFVDGSTHRWLLGVLSALHQATTCVSAACWLNLRAAFVDDTVYAKKGHPDWKSASLPRGWRYQSERGCLQHARAGCGLSPIVSAHASEVSDTQSSDGHSGVEDCIASAREGACKARRRMDRRHHRQAMSLMEVNEALRLAGTLSRNDASDAYSAYHENTPNLQSVPDESLV